MSANRAGMVIFDLDGTLTVPSLDFDAIRAEIGLPPGPILESLEALSPERRRAAHDVLHRHEERAARESLLQTGARETIGALRDMGFPIAVLTRNARRWAHVVFDKHDLVVDALRARDDGVIKPSPEPIIRLCAEVGVDPRASWMVGDHLFDLLSGNKAGCTTVLMVGDQAVPTYAAEADHVIAVLPELVEIVAAGTR